MSTKCYSSVEYHETEVWSKVNLPGNGCREAGSKGYVKHHLVSNNLTETLSTFYQTIFSNSSSVEEWEKSFEDVAGINVPGYIASVQKLVVSRARCVLMVGGGSFQGYTFSLYTKSHKKKPCFMKLNEWCKTTKSQI